MTGWNLIQAKLVFLTPDPPSRLKILILSAPCFVSPHDVIDDIKYKDCPNWKGDGV